MLGLVNRTQNILQKGFDEKSNPLFSLLGVLYEMIDPGLTGYNPQDSPLCLPASFKPLG